MSGDRQIQTARAFAPSDVATLAKLPEMEVKYRLLRNEWLTLHSRFKQAEERVFQAERSGRPADIADARADRAKLSERLGQLRRLTILARARAEAEVYMEICERVLPIEVKKFLQQAVEDFLRRPNNDTNNSAGAAKSKVSVEDYQELDALLKRWAAPVSHKDEAIN